MIPIVNSQTKALPKEIATISPVVNTLGHTVGVSVIGLTTKINIHRNP